jgi:recombination protein RecA
MVVLSLQALREKLDPLRRNDLRSDALGSDGLQGDGLRPKSLPLGMGSIDAALPEGGLPRGAIVEVSSARGLGRSTTLALEACRSAQAEARLRSGDIATIGAWCAFIDPWATLHAPGVSFVGVDLARLLVVRPPSSSIGRVAVRLARSRAFAVIVIDTRSAPSSVETMPAMRLDRDASVHVIRRLALAVEGTDTSLLLLTDSNAPRALPLPVSMRIELGRRFSPGQIVSSLQIPKERYGRISGEFVFDTRGTHGRRMISEIEQEDRKKGRSEKEKANSNPHVVNGVALMDGAFRDGSLMNSQGTKRSLGVR